MKDDIKDSLGPKLVLLIAGVLVALATVVTWYNWHLQEKGVIELMETSGAGLSSITASSLKQCMLGEKRDDVQNAVELLGARHEVSAIRILNQDGFITYASNREEIGKKLAPYSKQAQRVKKLERAGRDDATRVLEQFYPIENTPQCYNASCHAHKPAETLLGQLQIEFSLDPFDQVMKRSVLKVAIASSLGILLTAVFVFLALNKFVRKPVWELMAGVREISNGNLSTRVPEFSRDELGQLTRSFNRMAQELHKAHVELVDWAQTLEFRVSRKTEELERAQSQILQVEKMASLGRLAAVVAHEINNPLASVVTYAKLVTRKLKPQTSASDDYRDHLKYLDAIVSEAQRCGDIVSQLLSFVNKKQEKFEACDLTQIAEKAVFLLHYKMDVCQVKTEIEKTGDIPLINGDSSQIQQALMALLINACEAMETSGGLVRISLSRIDDFVRISIKDNGPGMEPDVAKKVFEPFFTTKSGASGVGLGLSVVYSIVMRHNGRIRLDTRPQKGAEFVIDLPVTAEEA